MLTHDAHMNINRFLFGAAGNTEMMARVPAIKASIDTLLALSNAQARGLPQELQYGGANHYTGSVNTFFESDTPTILGEAPNAPRWVEAKAGQLVFTISPNLFRGLSIDRFSGRMSGFPEVEGAGTFQVRVANALGCASFFFTFVVSEDPLVLAQKTPRLARRIELMMLVDPQEAERELKREKKSRLSRFAGPFPAAYQVFETEQAVLCMSPCVRVRVAVGVPQRVRVCVWSACANVCADVWALVRVVQQLTSTTSTKPLSE